MTMRVIKCKHSQTHTLSVATPISSPDCESASTLGITNTFPTLLNSAFPSGILSQQNAYLPALRIRSVGSAEPEPDTP